MQESRPDLKEKIRRILVHADIAFHVLAGLLLLIACGFIMYYGIINLMQPSRVAIISLVNDVLLALIILELFWTIIRFLKKQRFTLGPFLSIGIIASVRRILLVEIEISHVEHVQMERLWEIGLSALVILLLVFAYYLAAKVEKMGVE
ncbi:MAG: phosphate-starvation-inducible PsiE family protein [Thermodesulfobacteriota bacterium]|nr:phosphate-starvation-inducible PsiE family protein [Thermodesulfobacteriota bacterium]